MKNAIIDRKSDDKTDERSCSDGIQQNMSPLWMTGPQGIRLLCQETYLILAVHGSYVKNAIIDRKSDDKTDERSCSDGIQQNMSPLWMMGPQGISMVKY